MTFGFGCSVDTDSSRDFTYSEIGNSGRARNRLLVLKSSNECVGINTDDPEHKMHIVGKSGQDASLCIEAEGESRSSILYLGTSHNSSQGCYAKAAIIAEGIGSWSRSTMHFCLENTANNNSSTNVSIDDSKMTITMDGNVGIGHVRYPTAGCSDVSEAQPFHSSNPVNICLAHNGTLTNMIRFPKNSKSFSIGRVDRWNLHLGLHNTPNTNAFAKSPSKGNLKK